MCIERVSNWFAVPFVLAIVPLAALGQTEAQGPFRTQSLPTDRALRVDAVVVLDEAEAARGELVLVQPHDDRPDDANLAEDLPDLLLRREERHVADVQRGARA